MNVRHDMVNCHVVRPALDGRLGEFLQLRRAPGDYGAGMWAIVRGKIELGETASAAALRELREETGLVPEAFYALNTLDSFYLAHDDTVWHVPGFVALVARNSAVTLNEEHDAIRWVARTDIDASFLWPGERAQLNEACREVVDGGPAKLFLRLPLPR
jgi:dATP pyrophosphohydrolase